MNDNRIGKGSDGTVHVLVVGVESWTIRRASEQLEAAGVTTHHCHDSAASPFPCRALDPAAGCPLDTAPIGAVLAVRGMPRAGTGIDLGEMGAVCGLRSGVALVTAGLHDRTGLAAWGTAVDAGGDMAIACRQAAATHLAAIERVGGPSRRWVGVVEGVGAP